MAQIGRQREDFSVQFLLALAIPTPPANDCEEYDKISLTDFRADSLGVVLFATGGSARVKSVRAWEMMPSNPY